MAHLLLVGGLEHEGDGVRLVLRLHRDDVIVRCAPQDLSGTERVMSSFAAHLRIYQNRTATHEI
jgi:hypothetical protein